MIADAWLKKRRGQWLEVRYNSNPRGNLFDVSPSALPVTAKWE